MKNYKFEVYETTSTIIEMAGENVEQAKETLREKIRNGEVNIVDYMCDYDLDIKEYKEN